MREKSGWINTLATVVVSFGLIAVGWWSWDWCDYPIPSFLDPSYDPFTFPSEANALQVLAGRLSAARSDRIDRKIERRNERIREADAIEGFQKFRLAGNRI